MKKKSVYYVVFFLVLVVAFYLIMTKLVPGFNESRFPAIGSVQPFAFHDQDGELITENDVAGKVFVSEYFFTTCKSICPRLNDQMKRVHDRFKDEKNFLILSHTSDPETDSVGRLKVYADSMGYTGDNWLFLTGRKDSLYNMARFSYKIDDPNNNLKSIEDQFIHSQFFALVDQKGDVRKIYDGLKPSEVEALMKDIERLLKK